VDQAESWGIFGDLTTLYDMNAPWILPHLPPGKRRIVVINNEGGRIFARLPGLAKVPESFKMFTESRHRLRFRSWAEFWGWIMWNGPAARCHHFRITSLSRLCPEPTKPKPSGKNWTSP